MSDESNTKDAPASISESATAVSEDQNAFSEEKTKNSQIEMDSLDAVRSTSDEAIDSGLKTRTCDDSANTPDDDFELKWDDEEEEDDPISFDFAKHDQSTDDCQSKLLTDDDRKVTNAENVMNDGKQHSTQSKLNTDCDGKVASTGNVIDEARKHSTQSPLNTDCDGKVTNAENVIDEARKHPTQSPLNTNYDEKVKSAGNVIDEANQPSTQSLLNTENDGTVINVKNVIDKASQYSTQSPLNTDYDGKVPGAQNVMDETYQHSTLSMSNTVSDGKVTNAENVIDETNQLSPTSIPDNKSIENILQETEDSETEKMDIDTEFKADVDEKVVTVTAQPDKAIMDTNMDILPDIAKTSTPMKLLAAVIESKKEDATSSSTLDSSHLSIKPLDHGLNKPDFMIEIPTQELIDCEDLDSDSDITRAEDNSMPENDDPTNKLVVGSKKTEERKLNEIISVSSKEAAEPIDCLIDSDSKIVQKLLQNPENNEMVPQTTKSIIICDTADENEKLKTKDTLEKTGSNENEGGKDEIPEVTIKGKVDTQLQEPAKTDNITEIPDDIISLDDDDECENNQTESAVSKSADNTNLLSSDSKIEAPCESKVRIESVEEKLDSNMLEIFNDESDNVIFIDDDNTNKPTATKTDPIDGLKKIDNEIVAAIKSILPEDGINSTTDINLQETNISAPSNLSTDNLKTNDELIDTVSKDDIISKNIIESTVTTEMQDEESSKKEIICSDQKDATSKDALMLPDPSNDDGEDMTDTLGLLAESSRVMEDDEPEPDEEDDCDDDDDFDPDDDNSNLLLTAEHSEDSNPLQSDDTKDAPDDEKEMEKEEDNIVEEITVDRMDIDEVSVDVTEATVADKILEEIKDIPVKDLDVAKDVNKAEIENTKILIETQKESTLQEATAAADSTKDNSKATEDKKKSPSKTLKLEVAHPSTVLSFVELEESSSEDDIQEVPKSETKDPPAGNITTVNIPKEVDVMCSGGNTSDIVTKEGEVVISGVPKAPVHKPTRLNTSEVTIKTRSKTSTESSLSIPELGDKQNEKIVKNPDLEIVSLDSDEDDKNSGNVTQLLSSLRRCINQSCTSPVGVVLHPCTASIRALYATVKRDQRRGVCGDCLLAAQEVSWQLVEGVKNMTPLLELQMKPFTQEMVEISDSESDDDEPDLPREKIGKTAAEMLENQLVDILNETWLKYKMDERLQQTESELMREMENLQRDSAEIGKMLKDCEDATDKLRNELYASFEPKRKELCSITIFDTPSNVTRQSKRRMSSASETPSKRPAIPMGYSPLGSSNSSMTSGQTEVQNEDELDKDVSVVHLSAEAAPSELPPPGEACRAPLKAGAPVYAMRHAFGSWLKAKLLDVQPVSPYTVCRVKFDHKIKSPFKVLTARCLAYPNPSEVRMTIGTRVIALFRDQTAVKRESFYSGIVAEVPNPVNKYRYLIFFDDGYAQYVQHCDTRLVCQSSPLVWEEVHPFSREFVKEYLMAYPERPMVRLHAGQSLKAEWNGKWWASKVLEVDASLVQVYFEEDRRREWIYRGSTRLAPLYLELQAAERHRARALPRSKAVNKTNMPYVVYSRDELTTKQTDTPQTQQQQQNEEIRRQRAVAKKSTSALNVPQAPQQNVNLDAITSRLVYYTPKNAVKPYKMVRHTCGPQCRRSDVLALKDLRTYNPLAKPLLSGWERQLVRQRTQKLVMYRAPCGRRVRSLRELHAYLRLTRSELAVDLFDFSPNTHCLAEFVLNKCRVTKKDLSHGKENVPVPCVNYYDDSLPEFCSYNTERTPTAGVPLNLDPEFLCGCDCEDDCEDKSACACWRLTLEGARTIGLRESVGYRYKRLPDPLPSGIYECNSRCKCKQTCLNRVAQQPLQLKLQVFKTLSRGWGIRALNDVPKGSFLCVYAGNLLTDATANLDGLNEGDEYLAELDYIEVVEQMKEGYEEDIPEADKRLDEEESETETSEEEEEEEKKGEKETDDDFQPGYLGAGPGTEFSKRLRKREKKKGKEEQEKQKLDNKQKEKEDKGRGDDCITISDDEEVREPARFNAQAGMDDNAFISKHRSVRSHFGKDEACYIMDAKVQGNIGRYLNHSCQPNVFVQNVFVDTHDPRFPWVAFFALCHIKAGTELTWNYNYDVGSVPEKILYCHCGAANCRGRLL